MRLFIALSAIACLSVACTKPAEGDYTKAVQFDTTGNVGFEVRRVVEGRTIHSDDPVTSARNLLAVERGLCPGKFMVLKFSVEDQPPKMTYEARIRCL